MLHQFFVDALPTSGSLTLSGDDGRHATTVLRLAVGERIRVGDGRGAIAIVRVSDISKNSLVGDIEDFHHSEQPRISLSIIQALPKSDRSKEMLELLTEGGVNDIYPWRAERCIAQWQSDSHVKWQNSVREASKQSRRSTIPMVHSLVTLSDVRNLVSNMDLTLLFHENDAQTLSGVLATVNPEQLKKVALIIGPEGGISESEYSEIIAAGALSVRMGEPIFRAAHAGIAALAAVHTGLRLW